MNRPTSLDMDGVPVARVIRSTLFVFLKREQIYEPHLRTPTLVYINSKGTLPFQIWGHLERQAYLLTRILQNFVRFKMLVHHFILKNSILMKQTSRKISKLHDTRNNEDGV